MFFLLVLSGVAQAAGPRWVTGYPYFNNQGNAVIWYTDSPEYFTDPGDLSVYVNHAAADALVAAAASIWNVPTSRITLAQGGTLDEQVSGANVYLGSSGLVFPADVQSSNYAAKQIAVVYDRDGSVTDLLLGGGASDPAECRQNGVTEDVDSISPSGYIQHAVIVLNGRCTGSDPEAQLQIQYELERAFGRVLGLGWSQTNDNVFTGVPVPNRDQYNNWPLMHPIDVVCSQYTYQCMLNPFQLAIDDVASISSLYPVQAGAVPAGKMATTADSNGIHGAVTFPTGEAMVGGNLVVRRNQVPLQVVDDYEAVSGLIGKTAVQYGGNPVTPKPADARGSGVPADLRVSQGTTDPYEMSTFEIDYVPIHTDTTSNEEQDLLIDMEPVNPLYVGRYAVGPYPDSPVEPSGTLSFRGDGELAGYSPYEVVTPTGAEESCDTTGDGTEEDPAAVTGGGWWTGQLCPYGHAAWTLLPMKANRTATLEVTALDEQGLATTRKMLPVLGVWKVSDPTGTTPTVAAMPSAFNSTVPGMTTLGFATGSQDASYRMVIAEQRGDGRPDYHYRARLLYADTISPASAKAGTAVTITGVGFRAGNTVTIGGVNARVTSWSPTQIVATVPVVASVTSGTVPEDVVVTDLTTHGTTVMSGGLGYVYSVPVYTLQVVSEPTGSLPVGLAADTAFAVKALDVDGVTPLVGVPVTFSAVSGPVTWEACGAGTCTVTTDANGVASTTVTPAAAGAVTIEASGVGQVQQDAFTAVPLVRTVTVTPTAVYVAAGAAMSWTESAAVTQQGLAVAGLPVVWSGTGLTLTGVMGATSAAGGVSATVSVGAMTGGAQATGTVCAWGSVCGGFTVTGVDPAEFVVEPLTGAGQTVGASGSFSPVSVVVTDGSGHPVAGAEVTVHQALTQWTATCPDQGRCPNAPVYQSAVTAALSDANGGVVVTPLEMEGAETTKIVVTAGTQGFAAMTLTKEP